MVRPHFPFADYLLSRPADRTLAGNALDTPAKRLLQEITQSAIEEVAQPFASVNWPTSSRNG